MIQSKNYFIVKVNAYADKHLLDRYHKKYPDGHLPKQQHERARSYHAFQLGLIKFITGKDFQQMWEIYKFDVTKCAMEEIQETTGMHYFWGEGWETYMIPKDRKDILDWILENATGNPVKIMKKARIGLQRYRELPQTHVREHAAYLREKVLSKFLNKTGQ